MENSSSRSMKPLYKKAQIKAVDTYTADYLRITSFELMQKAGRAIYTYAQHFSSLLVVCGAGNNAGDGFIIAQLALQQQKKVLLWSLIALEKLPKDAKQAADLYVQAGGEICYEKPQASFDVIIDAIFGTGLSRAVTGKFAHAIQWLNSQNTPIIAVDIPSGLDADTGAICGCAVQAHTTVTVICYKIGLFTHNGKDLCGQLYLENLGIEAIKPDAVPSSRYLLDKSVLNVAHFSLPYNSHKGTFGQVVVVGGHDGMLGALLLASMAALRCGCGMVEAVSNNEQCGNIPLRFPELLTANTLNASRLLKSCQVIAIGPGLGLNQASKATLMLSLKQNKQMVLDADALTLIATEHYRFNHEAVLTPHPKEAARLLATDVATIQNDRVKSAISIAKKHHATVILKGSGTIIADAFGQVYVCPFGYWGMATAGMGDVLTGMVASLMAQGMSPLKSAYTATVWHALAASNCQKGRSLIATDVINKLADYS